MSDQVCLAAAQATVDTTVKKAEAKENPAHYTTHEVEQSLDTVNLIDLDTDTTFYKLSVCLRSTSSPVFSITSAVSCQPLCSPSVHYQ